MNDKKLIANIYDFMVNGNLTEDEKDKLYDIMQYIMTLLNKND